MVPTLGGRLSFFLTGFIDNTDRSQAALEGGDFLSPAVTPGAAGEQAALGWTKRCAVGGRGAPGLLTTSVTEWASRMAALREGACDTGRRSWGLKAGAELAARLIPAMPLAGCVAWRDGLVDVYV